MLSPGLLRLLLALVVVLHHSTPLRLGSWAVYVFFILSGYWVSAMWRKKYASTKSAYVTFLISRWWRLAPVLLLISALCVLASHFGIGVSSPFPNSPAWWGRQLLVAGSSSAGKILPPAWSLDVEAQFYLLAPLLIMLISRVSASVVVAGIGASTALLVRHVISGGSGEIAVFYLFAGFFLAGVLIEQRGWKPPVWMGFASLGLFAAEIAFLFANRVTRPAIWHAGRDTLAHAPAWAAAWSVVGALIVIPFVALNVRQKSPSFDRMLGNLAYPLYLFHWIPRDWYYSVSSPAHGSGTSMILHLAVNFASALGGATLILVCFDGPIDRLRDRWVKSRLLRAPQPAASTPATTLETQSSAPGL